MGVAKGKDSEKGIIAFLSVFLCFYSGTFDYSTAFEYNYGRKSKEVTIWANL